MVVGVDLVGGFGSHAFSVQLWNRLTEVQLLIVLQTRDSSRLGEALVHSYDGDIYRARCGDVPVLQFSKAVLQFPSAVRSRDERDCDDRPYFLDCHIVDNKSWRCGSQARFTGTTPAIKVMNVCTHFEKNQVFCGSAPFTRRDIKRYRDI